MDYIKTIKELASYMNSQAGNALPDETDPGSPKLEDKTVMSAIDELYQLGANGISAYNEIRGVDELEIFETPSAMLSAFLNFDSNRTGFSFISRFGYVIFIDDTPGHVLALGKKSPPNADNGSSNINLRQLIRLKVYEEGEKIQYEDNTGNPLDPGEIVALALKWLVER